MSGLPLGNRYDISDIDSEFLSHFDPLDDSLQTYQKTFQPHCDINLTGARERAINPEAVLEDEQHNLERKQEGESGKGQNSKKMKSKSKSSGCDEDATLEQIGVQAEGTSVAKKMDHNAKERIRRMKINASFLALRSLLPDSRRSKRSAPSIMDRVLKYIPELRNQIQELKFKKQSYQQHEASPKNNENPTSILDEDRSISISISRINRNEAMVQICMPSLNDESRKGSAFADMLQKVEDEGYLINSASTLYVCESRICHHLHIQVSGNLSEDENYVEELREKLFSWLR